MMQQEAETALLNSTTFPGFTTLSALEVFLLTYLLPAIMCHALQQHTSVTVQNAKNGVISQKNCLKGQHKT